MPQSEKLFGYAREELFGQAVLRVLSSKAFRGNHPGIANTHSSLGHAEPRPMGAGRDLYGLKKDGSEFPIEIGSEPDRNRWKAPMVLSAIVDISGRKRMEERFRQVVRIRAECDGDDRPPGNDCDGQHSGEKFFGYAREEIWGSRSRY